MNPLIKKVVLFTGLMTAIYAIVVGIAVIVLIAKGAL